MAYFTMFQKRALAITIIVTLFITLYPILGCASLDMVLNRIATSMIQTSMVGFDTVIFMALYNSMD